MSPEVSAVACGALSLVLALALGRPAIAWLKRGGFGSKGREDTPESHRAKAGTPSMGGIFLVPAAAAGMALAGGRLGLATAAATVAFSLVGAIDDIEKARRTSGRGVLARTKLALQVVLAAAVAGSALLVRGGGQHTALLVPALAGWVLLVVWIPNATNLTDGLDGLASGLTVLATLPLIAFGLLRRNPELAGTAAALAGACVGFLFYNRRPARVWMGDTGSLALGGALAAVAVYSRSEALLLVAALPFSIEALSVVIQVVVFQVTKRLRGTPEGRRVFRKSPLHHHFEEGGASERAVVLGFYAFGFVASAAAIAWMLRAGGSV